MHRTEVCWCWQHGHVSLTDVDGARSQQVCALQLQTAVGPSGQRCLPYRSQLPARVSYATSVSSVPSSLKTVLFTNRFLSADASAATRRKKDQACEKYLSAFASSVWLTPFDFILAHTHARTHTRTHARTHTGTQARTHTHTGTHAHTHAHRHTHTHTHTHRHAHTHRHTHARTHAHTYTHTRTHSHLSLIHI